MADDKSNNKSKRGKQPHWTPTQSNLKTIQEWAAMGMTEASIARQLGYNPTYFIEVKKKYPDVSEAIKRGKSSGEHLAVSHLWNIMNDPNHSKHFSAICFYLKTQHRWSETRNHEVTGSLSAVEVPVTQRLPDPKKSHQDDQDD